MTIMCEVISAKGNKGILEYDGETLRWTQDGHKFSKPITTDRFFNFTVEHIHSYILNNGGKILSTIEV